MHFFLSGTVSPAAQANHQIDLMMAPLTQSKGSVAVHNGHISTHVSVNDLRSTAYLAEERVNLSQNLGMYLLKKKKIFTPGNHLYKS